MIKSHVKKMPQLKSEKKKSADLRAKQYASMTDAQKLEKAKLHGGKKEIAKLQARIAGTKVEKAPKAEVKVEPIRQTLKKPKKQAQSH